MISRLQGTLVVKQPPALLVDVHGVGYELEAPMSTFYQLPELGDSVTLHTHFVVREDAQLLYGFATLKERSLFRDLIRVNGVGPRLALTILSGIDGDTFARSVREGDTGSLVRLPGIGKKTAERLIVEMRDRLGPNSGSSDLLNPPIGRPPTQADDAIGALLALGYKLPEANRMVNAVAKEGLNTEEIIKRALQSTLRLT